MFIGITGRWKTNNVRLRYRESRNKIKLSAIFQIIYHRGDKTLCCFLMPSHGPLPVFSFLCWTVQSICKVHIGGLVTRVLRCFSYSPFITCSFIVLWLVFIVNRIVTRLHVLYYSSVIVHGKQTKMDISIYAVNVYGTRFFIILY